jgi:hypothetical protein
MTTNSTPKSSKKVKTTYTRRTDKLNIHELAWVVAGLLGYECIVVDENNPERLNHVYATVAGTKSVLVLPSGEVSLVVPRARTNWTATLLTPGHTGFVHKLLELGHKFKVNYFSPSRLFRIHVQHEDDEGTLIETGDLELESLQRLLCEVVVKFRCGENVKLPMALRQTYTREARAAFRYGNPQFN